MPIGRGSVWRERQADEIQLSSMVKETDGAREFLVPFGHRQEQIQNQ